jgi:hypothetical protein
MKRLIPVARLVSKDACLSSSWIALKTSSAHCLCARPERVLALYFLPDEKYSSRQGSVSTGGS